jgi:hypothetical protein
MEGVMSRQQFIQYSRWPEGNQRKMAGKRRFSPYDQSRAAAQYGGKCLSCVGLADQLGRMTLSVKRRPSASA